MQHRKMPMPPATSSENRFPNYALRIMTSTETAHRFYLSGGYVDDGMPVGNFGTSSGYPMFKGLAV
jgi:hypothetical protein